MNVEARHSAPARQFAAGSDPDRDWWRGAVIYQVYPRSFQDTSGDGIGDLRGVAERLPHIASLGVDAVWIAPFFTSPMKDFGYDVSDFYGVDEMFGTLQDFDHVVAEAHRLGLRVMIDLVISHSSDQHAWFTESRSSRDNAKAGWYVWADPKPDGTPPNNWLSIFGGSAWEWDTARCQYYLHNFLASQPDLNFHNRDVQNALLDVARFWLDRGVDGFRMDTLNFYFCDSQMRDNPPLAPELRNTVAAPSVNPYNHQDHIHDKNRPDNIAFLQRFRAVMDEYPAVAAVGEIGDGQYGLQLAADYTSGDDKMHMCYNFEFLARDMPTPERISAIVGGFGAAAPDGWACWAFSNHDVMRHGSRWGDQVPERERYLKLLAAVILTLRGSVCLYQGEELGLTEADIAFEDLRDPYGIRFWPDFKGRDGCRTPMVWEKDGPSAGFTSGVPWLPVPAEHRHRAVDTQQHVHASMLNHYRRLIAFRKKSSAFAKGGITFADRQGGVLSYVRDHGNERVFCAFNLSAAERVIARPGGNLSVMEDHGFSGMLGDNEIALPPFDAFFARVG